ncbi:hypothetical protein P4O66_018693, partial [Electrophorus voltai]
CTYGTADEMRGGDGGISREREIGGRDEERLDGTRPPERWHLLQPLDGPPLVGVSQELSADTFGPEGRRAELDRGLLLHDRFCLPLLASPLHSEAKLHPPLPAKTLRLLIRSYLPLPVTILRTLGRGLRPLSASSSEAKGNTPRNLVGGLGLFSLGRGGPKGTTLTRKRAVGWSNWDLRRAELKPESLSFSGLASDTGGLCPKPPEANHLWDAPRAAGKRRTVGEGGTSATGADVHPCVSVEATDTSRHLHGWCNVVGSVPDYPERGREAAFLPLTLLVAPGLPVYLRCKGSSTLSNNSWWGFKTTFTCAGTKEVMHCSSFLSLLFQATSDKNLHWALVSFCPQTMTVPLLGKGIQISVDPWQVHIVKSPKMELIVYIHNSFMLLKTEEVIVHICKPTPQFTPKSLN